MAHDDVVELLTKEIEKVGAKKYLMVLAYAASLVTFGKKVKNKARRV